MKKILSIVAVLSLITLSLFAKSELEEGAFVIYPSRIHGRFNDNIVVVNKSYKDGISVKLYLKGVNDYEELQDVSLYHFDETKKIEAKNYPSKMKAKNISEIGIESLDGNTYVAFGYIERGDMYIEIRDEGSDLRKPVVPQFILNEEAVTFDRKSLVGSFDENIKIKNYTNLKGLTINVYVYDSKKLEWTTYGSATVNGRGDVTTVKSKKDLEDYKYFAFEATDGYVYNYMPMAADDDLIVNVSQ